MDAGVHLAALLGAVLLLSIAGGKYFIMYIVIYYAACYVCILCRLSLGHTIIIFPGLNFAAKKKVVKVRLAMKSSVRPLTLVSRPAPSCSVSVAHLMELSIIYLRTLFARWTIVSCMPSSLHTPPLALPMQLYMLA